MKCGIIIAGLDCRPRRVRPMEERDIQPSIKYLENYLDHLTGSKDKSSRVYDYICKARKIIEQLKEKGIPKVGRYSPVVDFYSGNITTNFDFFPPLRKFDKLGLVYEFEVDYWREIVK